MPYIIDYKEDQRREDIFFKYEYAEDMMKEMGLSYGGFMRWRRSKGLPSPPKNNPKTGRYDSRGMPKVTKKASHKIHPEDRLIVVRLVAAMQDAQDEAEARLGRPLNRVERERLVKEGMEG